MIGESLPLISFFVTFIFLSIYGSLSEVKKGAQRLAQLILGASHLMQTVIPKLLQPSSVEDAEAIADWKRNLCCTLSKQASCLGVDLQGINGLSVTTQSTGAMYTMVNIDIDAFDDCISNDIEFTKRLYEEDQVFVLPGSCFGSSNSTTINHDNIHNKYGHESNMYFFRVVFCAPIPILKEAANRIDEFCMRHQKKK